MEKNNYSINRYNWRLLAAVCLAAAFSWGAWAETIRISTIYPSPSGSYVRLLTTGGSAPADTILARNGGDVILAPSVAGRVGIGTASPAARAEVQGDMGVSADAVVSGDVKIGGNSAITRVICGEGLSCSIQGNELHISRVQQGSCEALCVRLSGTYGCCYPGDSSCDMASPEGPIRVISTPGPAGTEFATDRTATASNANNRSWPAGATCLPATYMCRCVRR